MLLALTSGVGIDEQANGTGMNEKTQLNQVKNSWFNFFLRANSKKKKSLVKIGYFLV